MNELQIFKNNVFGQVRVVEQDGEPWFVATDICKCLEIGDTSKATKRLDDDEKGATLIPTLGGKQKLNTVNEYGLYSLVVSQRPKSSNAGLPTRLSQVSVSTALSTWRFQEHYLMH